MMDGVPSRVNVLFVDSVQSWSVSLLFLEGVQSCVNVLFVDSVLSCVTAPELQEDWGGTITGNVY